MINKKKISCLSRVRSDAKFVDVANELRQELLSGRWAPGSKLPTWTELCERFSLGRPTLTRALEILKDEHFIVANSTRGTFVAEHLPHLHRFPLLFQGHPGEKGYEGWNLFWNALLRASKKGLFSNGDVIEPLLDANLHVDNVPGQMTLSKVQTKSIGGVLVAESTGLLGFPEQKDVPVVYLGWSPRNKCRLGITHDWDLFFKMGTEDLLTRGRNRIAVIANNLANMTSAVAEVRGQGATCPDQWCFAITSDVCMESVRNTIHLLLSGASGQRPDALLVTDDNLVPGVLAGIEAAKVSVPDDVIAVMHCNDVQEATRRPGVRSLCFPVEKALETAIGLAREARKNPGLTKHVHLSPEFV